MVTASDHGHDSASQFHLPLFPLPPRVTRDVGVGTRQWQRAKFEEVRAGDLWVGKRRSFESARPTAYRTGEHICIGQILRDEVREPVGELVVVNFVGFNGRVDDLEIAGTLFLFLDGAARRGLVGEVGLSE